MIEPPPWVPWTIAAVAVLAAVAGWLREPAPAPVPEPPESPVEAPAEDAGPSAEPDPPPSPLAALTACAEQVGRLRAALDEAEDPPEPSAEAVDDSELGAVDGGIDPEVAACLTRPGVGAAVRAADRAQAEREHQERSRRVRAGLATALGVTEDDVDWIGTYACAVRALRSDALTELREGRSPSSEVFAQIGAERDATLADVRERLGEERYRDFRAVGGVGLLADARGCPDG